MSISAISRALADMMSSEEGFSTLCSFFVKLCLTFSFLSLGIELDVSESMACS